MAAIAAIAPNGEVSDKLPVGGVLGKYAPPKRDRASPVSQNAVFNDYRKVRGFDALITGCFRSQRKSAAAKLTVRTDHMTDLSTLVVGGTKVLLKTMYAALLGVVVGGVCGAAILSFGALIGKSGTTGTDYVGYWDVSLVWLGLLYGGFFGLVVAPLGYVLARRVGIRRAFWPATTGTLIGGLLGAFGAEPLAVGTALGGFILGLLWANRGSV
jgi:hypothetical protein